MNWIGAIVFAYLAGIRLRQVWLGDWFLLPLALHAGLAALLLVSRRQSHSSSSWLWNLVAWSSAFLPFAMQTERTAPLIATAVSGLGVCFSVWALCILGKSFGIAPADRGLIIAGPYRWVRHPMYAGELLSWLVMFNINPTVWNWIILSVLLLGVALRMEWEERCISGYSEYSGQTRWRVIPGLW